MTKLLTACFVFIYFTTFISAQESIPLENIDSLIKAALKHEKSGNFDSTLLYYQEALRFAELFKDNKHSRIARLKADLGTILWRLGRNKEAKGYLIEAIDSFRMTKSDSFFLASTYNNLGNVWKDLGQYENAEKEYLTALEIREKKFGENDVQTASSYYDLGNFYWEIGKYDEALELINNAYKIFKSKYGEPHPTLSLCFDVMGNISYSRGDSHKAMEFYNASIRNHTWGNTLGHIWLGYTYSNMGNIFGEWEQYEKAYEYFDKSLHIRVKQLGANHDEVAQSYINKAAACSLEGDQSAAIENSKRAIGIWEELSGDSGGHIGIAHNRLGIAYLELGELDSAYYHFLKALDVLQQYHGKNHPEVALSYSNIALYFERINEQNIADEYFQKALENLNVNPDSLKNPQYVTEVNYVIEILNKQTEVLEKRYSKKRDSATLMKLFNQCRLANDFFEKYKYTNVEPSSIRLYFKNAKQIYEREIAACNAMPSQGQSYAYVDTAYMTSGKVKANMLLKSFYESEAKQLANIPDSILIKEKQLNRKINQLEKELFLELQKEDNKIYSTILEKEYVILESKRSLDELKNDIGKKYPKYFQLVYDHQVPNIKKIQKELLLPDQALLEYFVGDSSIYLFYIDEQTVALLNIKKDFPLEKWVNQMRDGIMGYWEAEVKTNELAQYYRKQYTEAAYNLYKKLIGQIRDKVVMKRSLVIIPDGVLGYLPFGVLLTEPIVQTDNFRDFPYLLKEKALSFAYSSALLLSIKKRKTGKKASKKLLVVAPEFTGSTIEKIEPDTFQPIIVEEIIHLRNILSPLIYNKSEAVTLLGLMDGDILESENATVENFINLAADYQILHLTTHGQANDESGEYSYIAFSEYKDKKELPYLYTKDLYNLSLNADLVTLSACETGIGELQLGEGIIGQTSGFFYAGAKSMATTLWNIDDASTSDLMAYFYANIESGMRKDIALQKAQLDYLKYEEKPHPYFWASFILAGDISPVNTGWCNLVFIVGVLFIGVLLFWFYLKRM